jgi:hypothetical protein
MGMKITMNRSENHYLKAEIRYCLDSLLNEIEIPLK